MPNFKWSEAKNPEIRHFNYLINLRSFETCPDHLKFLRDPVITLATLYPLVALATTQLTSRKY